MLRLGYNTNGFPQHELGDIADLLSVLGYNAIAITPDVFHLDPYADGVARARELRPRLTDLRLAVALETGARFLVDRRRKHWPTLLDEDDGAARRLDMLRRCFELAVALEAETFSFWSGRAPAGQTTEETLDRLCHGATALLDEARGSGVQVCFEPEPGMAVASIEEVGEFLLRLDREDLKLMLDVGHVPVTESIGPGALIRAFGHGLGGIQLDDSADGVHEHLLPGDGEIDFADVNQALHEVQFAGLACFELPRHGHDPVETARVAIRDFRKLEGVR